MKAVKWVISMKTVEELNKELEKIKLEKDKMKARADKVRVSLSGLKDSDLVYFADSIYFSSFKSVTEHIKDVANEYDPQVPF